MVTFGIDPHKRTHTVAAVDGLRPDSSAEMTVTRNDVGGEPGVAALG